MHLSVTNTSLSAATGIDSTEVAVRKQFLEITEADMALLRKLHAYLENSGYSFAETFYRHMMQFPELRALVKDDAMLERLKRSQASYFSGLTVGEYGPDYVEDRLHVGMIHQRVGLAPKWYIGAYRKYLAELVPMLWQVADGDIEDFLAIQNALFKIIFFDMGLALDTYFHAERQALARVLGYAEQIIAEMPSGLAVLDAQLAVRSLNPEFARMFNLKVDVCVGRNLAECLAIPKLLEEMARVRDSSEPCLGLSFAHPLALGGTGFYLANISRADMGEEISILVMVQDLTASKVAESRVQYLAQHDGLTGLLNRASICERATQAIAVSKRDEELIAVMLIDLDRFKLINESQGHVTGDKVLVQAAERLKSHLREGDAVGRMGGDEFVLMLPRLDTMGHAAAVAKKVMELFAAPFVIDDGEVYLTASVGIALYPSDGGDALELIKSADTALHQAKKEGRNQFRFYQAEMNARVQREQLLESGLHHALQQGEFELHYQPKVDLRSGKISGVEALMRWRHPERGLIQPDEFIPLLEETGMILPVGEWVLHTACTQAQSWQRAGFPQVCMAVNLSPHQFRQANLCEMVERTLHDTGLEARCLELEITESAIMHNVEEADRTLRQLKEMGVRLAVDDFGTGYSSLSYLKRFAIDTVKVDRSFIHDLITDPDDALITRSVIQLAHNLRLKVVAEGVETEAQLAFLMHNHCDEIQGFYYSQPLLATEYAGLLGENRPLKRPQQGEGRTILLVDDEANILAALKRLLRRDDYQVLATTSAREGFELLAANQVGVIISDQRMPEMSGTEFLSRVKDLYPDTIRMVLSGYTDLKSVTDAINTGAIYKFLTKPWEDDLLRANIDEAFQRYEMTQENQRLERELFDANLALKGMNQELELRANQKAREAIRNLDILRVSQEVLEHLPVAVVGVDLNGIIVVSNRVANRFFNASDDFSLVGEVAAHKLFAELLQAIDDAMQGRPSDRVDLSASSAHYWCHALGETSSAEGVMLVVAP